MTNFSIQRGRYHAASPPVSWPTARWLLALLCVLFVVPGKAAPLPKGRYPIYPLKTSRMASSIQLDETYLQTNSVFIAGYYSSCPTSVELLVNGQPVSPSVPVQDVGYGLYQATIAYGTLPLGATVQLHELCTGNYSNIGTVRDVYGYVELSGGASNGISSTDQNSPYSRLTTPTQIQSCASVTVGAHAGSQVRLSLASHNAPLGAFLINGQTPSNSDFLIYSPDEPNPNVVFTSTGTTASQEYATAVSKQFYFGPTTVQYTHNGTVPTNDLSLSLGPIGVQQINVSNGQLTYKYYTNGDYNSRVEATWPNVNAVIQLIFDGTTYSIVIDGTVIATVNRTVQYSTNIGSLSSTAQLPYGTSVTYTPSATGGTGYIRAVIDGYLIVQQSINDIAAPTAPTVAFSTGGVSSAICAGQSVTLNATGCSGTVTWSNGQTGASITDTPGSTTNYTATCTTNGCPSAASAPATVTVNPIPATPTLSTTLSSLCVGSQTTLTAAGCGGTLNWNTGETGASITVSPTTSLTYTVTCTQNGCTSPVGSIAISVNSIAAAPTLSASTATICAGGQATLNASGCSGTVNWSTGATGVSITVSPNTNTTYSATCTENGCVSSPGSVAITVYPIPAAPTLTAALATICAGSQSTLTVAGCNGIINWGTGETGATLTVSPTSSTTYTATCTENGCVSAASWVLVTVNPIPGAPTLVAQSPTICQGASTQLTASNCAGRITWSTGETNTIITVGPNTTTTYTATCDLNGCISSQGSVQVTVNPAPGNPTVAPATPAICVGGQTTLTASGCATGADYVWNDNVTGASRSVSSNTVGTINYSVKCSLNGCLSDVPGTVTLTVNPIPVAPTPSPASLTVYQYSASQSINFSGCTGTVNWSGTDGSSGTGSISLPTGNVATITYQATCTENGCTSSAVSVPYQVIPNNPPSATPDNQTVPFNTPTTICVLNNDHDDKGNAANTSNVTSPAVTGQASHGTITVDANGCLIYTPNQNYVGTDEVTYQICNPQDPSKCSSATVIVSVQSAPPVANPDAATTSYNTPYTVPVLGNDTDKTGAVATTSNVTTPVITTQPANGSVKVNPDGTITYTPNSGFVGNDPFTYQICDNQDNSKCSTATVTMTVQSAPPTPHNDATTTAFNSPVVMPVLLDDTDKNNSPATLTNVTAPVVVTQPGHGTASVNADGTITYTPTPGFVGQDQYTYQICDNQDNSKCATAVATVTVNSAPPTAKPDNQTVPFDTPTTICVLNNDTDKSGSTATTSNVTSPVVTTQPTNGTVTVDENGCLHYIPNPGYVGGDNIVYQICDTQDPSKCSSATVTITVQSAPPVASNDQTTTAFNTPVNYPVLANDHDKNGSNATLTNVTAPTIVAQPGHGTASVNGDGTISYTPSSNYVGQDVLTYQICDNQDQSKCSTATLTITVNSAPPTAKPDNQTVPFDTPTTICVLNNDIDKTGAAATTSNVTSPVVTSNPKNGSVNVDANGCVIYTPKPGFVGTDTLTYQICDQQDPTKCSSATVIVSVQSAPPVANPDLTTTAFNTLVTYPVLSNDTDKNGSNATLTNVTAPTIVAQPGHGTASVNGDGTISYTPAKNYVGTDVLTYQICDKTDPSKCVQTTFTVNVQSAPPVANPDQLTVPFNTPGKVCILVNDTDKLGAAASASNVTTPVVVSQPAHGTATIGADGCLTFTPEPGFVGTDQITYQICDLQDPSKCSTAVVDIKVNSAPPLANPDAASTLSSTPVAIPILGNDTDKWGFPANTSNTTTPVVVSQPSHGTVVINGDGTATYTPGNSYAGSDSFIYQICDNQDNSLCDTAIVHIVVGIQSPVISLDKQVICQGDVVTLTAANCPGTVNWSTGQTGTSIQVTPSVDAAYTATCTLNGITSTPSNIVGVTVHEIPSTPTISFSTGGSIITVCIGSQVTLNAEGCTGTVNWSNGQTGSSITVTPNNGDTYTATCTILGCISAPSAQATAYVATPPAAPVAVGPSGPVCPGTPVQLSASGCDGLYVWSDGQQGANITVTPNSTTNYSVYCQQAQCASSYSNQVTVTVVQAPDPVTVAFFVNDQNVGSTAGVCQGTQVKVVAFGCDGGTITWSNGLTGTFLLVNADQSMQYTATCSNGVCQSAPSNVASLNVTPIPAAPVLSASSLSVCVGTPVSITATYNGSIKWSTGDTTAVITVMPTDINTYSAYVMNNGCQSDLAKVSVIAYSIPVAPAISFQGSSSTSAVGYICAGNSITLTATSLTATASCDGGTITWSNGQTGNTLTVSPTVSTTYAAMCVSQAGCSSPLSNTLSVNVTPLPGTPSIVPTGLGMCQGDTLRLSLADLPAGYTPIWNTGDTTKTILITQAGPYAVAYRDASGCQTANSDTANVVVYKRPAKPVLALSSIMDVVVTDDSLPSPYKYRWYQDGTRDVTADNQLQYRPGVDGTVTAERRAEYYLAIPNTNPVLYDTLVCPVSSSIAVKVEADLIIYPNPTTGPVTVETRGRLTLTGIRVRLWDELGRQIYEGFTSTLQNGKLTIDLTNLPDAVYVMQLYSDTYRNTWKVIKLSHK